MKFSMSTAWNDATAMMSANREVLLILAAMFFLLPSLVPAIFVPDLQTQMMADPEAASAMMADLFENWGVLLIVVGIALLLAQIVGYLAMLALLRDTSRPTVGEALATGLAGLLPAIGVYLVLAVGVVAAMLVVGVLASASAALGVIVVIACIIGLFYLMVKLSLVMAVIAIDKVGNPLTVIGRSWALTKGNSFRLFLFFVLLVIVYLVISIVFGALAGVLFAVAGTSMALLLNGIVSAIIGTAFTVVFVAVIAAIHRQLSGPSAAAVSATFE